MLVFESIQHLPGRNWLRPQLLLSTTSFCETLLLLLVDGERWLPAESRTPVPAVEPRPRPKCQHELAELCHEQRSDRASDNAAFPASERRAADNYSCDGGKQIVVARRLRRAANESGQQHPGGREAHRRCDISANPVLEDPHPGGFAARGLTPTATNRRPIAVLRVMNHAVTTKAKANSTLAGRPMNWACEIVCMTVGTLTGTAPSTSGRRQRAAR